MSLWITIWTLILVFGIGAFILSFLVIMPLGARDIWVLLGRLTDQGPAMDRKSGSESTEEGSSAP